MSIQYNVDICQNSLILYDHTKQYATNDKYSVYDASTNARVTMNVDGTLTGNVSTVAELYSQKIWCVVKWYFIRNSFFF
jgi:hypothetical protein